MDEKTNSIIVVGVLILMLLTAGLTYYITKTTVLPQCQTNTTDKPTISVSGEATRTVTPDLLSIGFTIKTSGPTTSEADVLNSAETAKVKAALLAAGLGETEIHSQSYSTYPVYNQSCYPCKVEDGIIVPATPEVVKDYSGAISSVSPPYCRCGYESTITGYQTTHQILITSKSTNEGGKYIDAAVKSSNSTNVDYVYFSLTDKTRIQVQAELQTEAAASAKTKAGNIAKGLGASIGKIVSVNPTEYPIYPVYAYNNYGATDMKAPLSTEIFPTSTTLSSSVTVVYEIVQ